MYQNLLSIDQIRFTSLHLYGALALCVRVSNSPIDITVTVCFVRARLLSFLELCLILGLFILLRPDQELHTLLIVLILVHSNLKHVLLQLTFLLSRSSLRTHRAWCVFLTKVNHSGSELSIKVINLPFSVKFCHFLVVNEKNG